MNDFLRAIEIENFKAFGNLQRFDLRTINILYGQNSSGKSSFLHAIVYLKEVIERSNADARQISLGEEVVDLGGFYQFVHDQDDRKNIRFRLSWDFREDFQEDLLRNLESVILTLEIGTGSDGIPALLAVSFESFEQELLRLARGRADLPFVLQFVERQHPILADVSPDPDRSSWIFGRSVFGSVDPRPSTGDMILPEESRGAYELVERLDGRLKSWLASIVYVGPLRTYPARDFRPQTVVATGRGNADCGSWERLSTDKELRDSVNDWMERFGVSSKFTFAVREWLRTENLDRLKRDPAALVSKIQASIDDQLPPDEQVKRLLETASAELGAFFEHLAGAIRGYPDSHFPELYVKERGSAAVLSHRDIGMGYSQIVPVLVAAVGSVQKTVLIEQPELHIHPGLQCDLADLFLESADRRSNIFIIETHSEHILLRLLRRLGEREASPVEMGKRACTASDVRFLFLRRDSQSTSVQSKRPAIDGRGFADGWPEGFFGERLPEIIP